MNEEKQESIEQREDRLFGPEAQMANEVLEWFETFVKIQRLAVDGTPAQDVAELLKQMDTERLWNVLLKMRVLVGHRFLLEKARLDQRKQSREAGALKAKEFTEQQILDAREKVGPKQEPIAAELGCDVKTLRRNLRRLDLKLP